MKISLNHILFSGLCLASLLAFTGCTPAETGGGSEPGAFYGPNTSNTPDYTDNMRSEFRNNW
ncbi:hypothetical protein N9B21_01815 [Verrucomicrobiales bacterium]|nr:hypothetical protein [Verrucomicrobiales bacterium]